MIFIQILLSFFLVVLAILFYKEDNYHDMTIAVAFGLLSIMDLCERWL